MLKSHDIHACIHVRGVGGLVQENTCLVRLPTVPPPSLQLPNPMTFMFAYMCMGGGGWFRRTLV